jgi:hypothetical protein
MKVEDENKSLLSEKDEMIKHLRKRIKYLKARLDAENHDLGKINFYILNLERAECKLMGLVVFETSKPVIN